jgi:hypothetical protein
MEKTKKLTQIFLAGTLSAMLSACGDDLPEIKKCKDLTGDGLIDVLMWEDTTNGSLRGNYLFIAQKDGTFVRAQEKNEKGTKYFMTEDKIAYFFNGKFYQKSEKETEQK